jgi:hypothetical protein
MCPNETCNVANRIDGLFGKEVSQTPADHAAETGEYGYKKLRMHMIIDSSMKKKPASG